MGSTRAGFCFLNAATGEWQTNVCGWREQDRKLRDARSLEACREHVIRFVRAMRHHFPPATIAYERPTGRFANPSLGMHAGVVVEAVTVGAGMAPWPVPVASWKQAFVGRGDASKDYYSEYAVSLGCPDDADQAAALGVAVVAAKEILRFDATRLASYEFRGAA